MRRGLPGFAVSLRAFGTVPSIRDFESITAVIEIMAISSKRPLKFNVLNVENKMVVSYVGTAELFIYN